MDNQIKEKLDNIWIEKYRPFTIADLVCNDDIKEFIQDSIMLKDFPNLLLYGNAGTGKNSITNVLIHELDCNALIINASSENGIDVVREKIETFAKSASWGNKLKVVVLNEADGISFSAQNGLKEVMESTLDNCRFILTTNSYNKINPALISRCCEFQIAPNPDRIRDRLQYIFMMEHINYDNEYVNRIIKTYDTNIRKMIGESYKYFKMHGDLKADYIENNLTKEIVDLFDQIFATKDVKKINEILNKTIISEDCYTMLKTYCVEKYNNPDMVISVCDYAYKSKLINDKDLCFLSCILELKNVIGG